MMSKRAPYQGSRRQEQRRVRVGSGSNTTAAAADSDEDQNFRSVGSALIAPVRLSVCLLVHSLLTAGSAFLI